MYTLWLGYQGNTKALIHLYANLNFFSFGE
jgi:hypothetical protein